MLRLEPGGVCDRPGAAHVIGSLVGRTQIVARDLKNRAFGEDHRPLDHILQLADIPRPRIFDQRGHGLRRNGVDGLADPPAELLDKVANQQRNVFRPLAQGGDPDRENIER